MKTRALLLCGVLAGPMYVTVTLIESLTRDGFDMKHHRFTQLTTGDLGWIHQSAMVLVGLLSVLLAAGVRQVVRTGRAATWAPRVIGLFGVAYIIGGLLRADLVAGFPPGTTPELVQHTWHGIAQNASRSLSTILLIASSLVMAGWFSSEGRRGWALFYGVSLPIIFAVLTLVGFLIGVNPIAPAFLAGPWVFMTALALHLYQLAAPRSRGVPAGQGMKSTPVTG